MIIKIKKHIIYIFSIILVMLFCSVSCSSEEPYVDETEANEYFYDQTEGIVYTDLSKNFDIKIEKWSYYYDEEEKRNRILLSILIKNKTGERLDNFVGTLILNEEATDLIASGITIYDNYESYSLVPEVTANGISYSIDVLITEDNLLNEKNADKDILLDKIRYATLDLKWKGGDETIDIILDELSD